MKGEWGIYKHPVLLYHLHKIKKHIYTRVADVTVSITTDSEPIPYDERLNRNYRPLRKGDVWGKAYDCAWLHVKGVIPAGLASSHIVVIVTIDGEGVCYNNGMEVCAINSRCTFMDYLQPTWDRRVIAIDDATSCGLLDVWIDISFNGKMVQPFGKAKFHDAYIALCRDDIKDMYYEYLTYCYACLACDDTAMRHRLLSNGDAAYKALQGYLPPDVAKAKAILNRAYTIVGGTSDYGVTAVGQGHLDLAWLWPVRESKRKAVRTFVNALRTIDQYPEFVFGASQPQQFEWIKLNDPGLYMKIKQAVATGNIELQGGMWVECDTNLPCGESLIRQIYYGKKFFYDEFGMDIVTCWLPDAFGFNANLPQILKKCGIHYFATIKLAWNEYNKFPHTTFNWVGIDGSSVLAHMPPEGDYTSGATPLCVKQALDNFIEKDRLGTALLVYGNGDGGGGPTQTHVELIKRQQTVQWLPRVEFGRAVDFFKRLEHYKDVLPVYKGELYLEKHQGTYTTQAQNKYYNRKLELLLHECEYLAACAYLKGYSYPHALFDRIWKEVLLYQFHDILPGSSVKRVYDESTMRYKEMMAELEDVINNSIRYLSDDSHGKSCINAAPFARTEFFKVDSHWYSAEIAGYSSVPLKEVVAEFPVSCGSDYIENDYLKAKFSKAGYIVSLFDKINNTEVCGDYFNKLILYTDRWKFYNAWDIDSNYRKKKKIALTLVHCETFVDGPMAVRRNYYNHKKTTLRQDVTVYAGKPYIEFDTECDYHETFKMLRADFMPLVFDDTVLCDIQFGHYGRSTKDGTSLERAQYEICAHKWVDVSNSNYGVALINDCKYGHRVKEGVISLNLLRSPVYPDPSADRGKHVFKYALYPHTGDFKSCDTLCYGYIFNYAPRLADGTVTIPQIVCTNNNRIIIETVKKAELQDAIVIRAYECYGNDTIASFDVSFNVKQAYEADMLENVLNKTNLQSVTFTPFEIKTFVLQL